jgi:uracil-DNA glycosylase
VLTDWNPLLRQQFSQEYWAELQGFVQEERRISAVYPPDEEVYAALHLTAYADVKVLILGQDPYHGERQAHGLCFSVQRGVAIPPSLRNVYKELHSDLGLVPPNHGNLETWAKRGVLLLNAVLTVRSGNAGSHRNRGWETFTDEIIRLVNQKNERVVFILWGAFAQKKKPLIDLNTHYVIEAPHPSPLSAHRGFLGSRPFSRANQALAEAGRSEVDWALPHN